MDNEELQKMGTCPRCGQPTLILRRELDKETGVYFCSNCVIDVPISKNYFNDLLKK